MKIQTFTTTGRKSEDTNLPKELSPKVNLPLLAQAVYVYEKRSHFGLRKTKTRSEVLRTTKKLYRQKGTGGARHGSKRAPIFVGGGVALGPRPIEREVSLPNKIKNKAKFMAFALKAEEGKMVFVSGISKLGKTKEAKTLIDSLEKATKAKNYTFVLSEDAKDAIKALKNLANTKYVPYRNVNALDVYKGGVIILDKDIFKNEKKTDKAESKIKKVVKTRAVKK